ncbi:ejaculatory bulb-specific protein 3 [Agrilus planipennis]|uniref:Ejaculatory bulb-specific protein 3 n=1 Tax=Agrilus planipennis TaxID=224129 RepID=A0A1W4WBY9_AGRPL|nr:ejaculatory bulb-specific protein 3 [Agrilus planipennis]
MFHRHFGIPSTMVMDICNTFAVICFALFGSIVSAGVSESPKYTTKYDNIDLDEIIKSERLLKNYVNCLLDDGPCTPDGNELKHNMPDALETNCSKCSEKQKEMSDRMVSYLIENRPVYWSQLEKKYDPSGEYTKKYKENKAQEVTVVPANK